MYFETNYAFGNIQYVEICVQRCDTDIKILKYSFNISQISQKRTIQGFWKKSIAFN